MDVDLADVIAALWARGIDTEQSCQEHRPGTVWVAFPTADDALAFCRAVGLDDEADDDLTYRALAPDVASPDSTRPLAWEWDWSAKPEPSLDAVAVAVEFPRSDLPAVRERLGESAGDAE